VCGEDACEKCDYAALAVTSAYDNARYGVLRIAEMRGDARKPLERKIPLAGIYRKEPVFDFGVIEFHHGG